VLTSHLVKRGPGGKISNFRNGGTFLLRNGKRLCGRRRLWRRRGTWAHSQQAEQAASDRNAEKEPI